MEYLKFLLTVIKEPIEWVSINKYNKEYDLWFANAIKNYEFVRLNEFEVMIDGKILWAANYPYGIFSPRILKEKIEHNGRIYYMTDDPKVRYSPSKFNIYKANKKLKHTLGV